jgi:hypothetical protein
MLLPAPAPSVLALPDLEPSATALASRAALSSASFLHLDGEACWFVTCGRASRGRESEVLDCTGRLLGSVVTGAGVDGEARWFVIFGSASGGRRASTAPLDGSVSMNRVGLISRAASCRRLRLSSSEGLDDFQAPPPQKDATTAITTARTAVRTGHTTSFILSGKHEAARREGGIPHEESQCPPKTFSEALQVFGGLLRSLPATQRLLGQHPVPALGGVGLLCHAPRLLRLCAVALDLIAGGLPLRLFCFACRGVSRCGVLIATPARRAFGALCSYRYDRGWHAVAHCWRKSPPRACCL